MVHFLECVTVHLIRKSVKTLATRTQGFILNLTRWLQPVIFVQCYVTLLQSHQILTMMTTGHVRMLDVTGDVSPMSQDCSVNCNTGAMHSNPRHYHCQISA
jgi:hypothetical protein